MKSFKELSLNAKMLSGILATVFVVQILGFSISFYSDAHMIEENFLNEKTLTIKIVSGYTVTDLLFSNKSSGYESLAYLKRDSSILNAYLLDDKNDFFVSLNKKNKNKLQIEYNDDQPWHSYIDRQLHLFEPIFFEEKKIGGLYIIASTEEYVERINTRILYFLALLLALSLAALVIAGRLSKFITAPINKLAKFTKSITENENNDINLEPANADEIGQLYEAYKRMLIKIKKRDARQQEILDSMVNAVITIDENGGITSFNGSAESMFGYVGEELIGKNIRRLMPQRYSEHHDDYISTYLKTGKTHVFGIGRELVGVRKNNEEFPLHLTVAELQKDENGKRSFIGTCQDLSSVKQQHEQLRRTQKMDALGKLTGGIAHDYNNMLGVILGYSELLKSQLSETPKLLEYVNHIYHAGERGANLTKKMLSFSKSESTENTQINLNSMLLDQQDILQKTLTVSIKLILELEQNIWSIFLDPSDLENAILNLCINAMHALKAESNQSGIEKLTIRTTNQSMNYQDALALGLQLGDYVQLSFTDTGCGMDEETKERIFDPFFTTKGSEGTGLGLSQVFGLIKRANGAIKVYSELDHGTQFVLYFPRYTHALLENDKLVTTTTKSTRGYETILVVDDEDALRTLCFDLLSEQGYRVLCAESGTRALEILKTESVDLMLTDIIMPEMDGYQLVEKVQRLYPKIKIQLASGFSDERHKDLTNEKFHKHLLHKPYNSNTLFKRLRSLLDE